MSGRHLASWPQTNKPCMEKHLKEHIPAQCFNISYHILEPGRTPTLREPSGLGLEPDK